MDDKAFRGLRRDDLAMLLGLAVVALPGGHSGRFLGLSGGHSSHSFSSSEGEGGEKEEGKETQLDLVHRIFMANAFRTQVVGVGVEEMIIAVREGKEKEGKEAPPVPEGWEKVMDFQSAFVESEFYLLFICLSLCSFPVSFWFLPLFCGCIYVCFSFIYFLFTFPIISTFSFFLPVLGSVLWLHLCVGF